MLVTGMTEATIVARIIGPHFIVQATPIALAQSSGEFATATCGCHEKSHTLTGCGFVPGLISP
jgi:hypothetical protein